MSTRFATASQTLGMFQRLEDYVALREDARRRANDRTPRRRIPAMSTRCPLNERFYFCLVQAQSFAQLQTPLLSHSQLFLPHALQLMVSSSFSLIARFGSVEGDVGMPVESAAVRRTFIATCRPVQRRPVQR